MAAQTTEPGPTNEPTRLDAPWTGEQVEALNFYQDSGVFHPFTSENGIDLIATRDGWVEREGGPVVQTWAHSFMAEMEAIKHRQELMSGTIRRPEESEE